MESDAYNILLFPPGLMCSNCRVEEQCPDRNKGEAAEASFIAALYQGYNFSYEFI